MVSSSADCDSPENTSTQEKTDSSVVNHLFPLIKLWNHGERFTEILAQHSCETKTKVSFIKCFLLFKSIIFKASSCTTY